MAKYSAVKATVNAYIKQNGRKEITGKVLNAVLNATIDSLGKYFQFAGGASPTDDPGTPDQNVCYLAGEPGVYTNFGSITIENEEVALLFWDGEWTKQRILIGIREVNASVDNQVGTPSVDVSYSGGELVLTFHNLKGGQGETGDPAGFGTIGADINGGVGTPGVSVETSGDNTAKNLMFHFTNLKGETGVTSVVATIDDTSGTPSCQVSLVGQQLTLAFSGLKGLKGDTGVSADYPITIYNGLDSDATDQALAAAQGKVLDGKVSQLGQELNEMIEENPEADFSISDSRGMAIVQFKGGDVNTKNFDSTKTPKQDDMENGDLDISDEDGNVLVRFKDGHIKTKEFDSSKLADDYNIIDVVGRYAGKRVSILGDSISTYGDPSSTNENGTYCYSYYPSASCRYSQDGVDSIAFDVKNTYWMKLIGATGMKLGINDSYRGTRVSGTSIAFNLQTRINHLGENGTPDVILVYGGTNDAGGGVTIGTFNTENPQNYTDAQIAALPVTTFADAYRTMLIRLMKTYPLAEIVVILPTFTTSYYTITNLDLYVEIIKEACDFFGIKYIDARCTGINVYNRATYLVDGIHPNIAGMNLLFKKIYRQLIFN